MAYRKASLRELAVWFILATQVFAVVLLALEATQLLSYLSQEFVKPLVGSTVDCGWEHLLVEALTSLIAFGWLGALALFAFGAVLSLPLVATISSKPLLNRAVWLVALLTFPLPTVGIFCLEELHRIRQQVLRARSVA